MRDCIDEIACVRDAEGGAADAPVLRRAVRRNTEAIAEPEAARHRLVAFRNRGNARKADCGFALRDFGFLMSMLLVVIGLLLVAGCQQSGKKEASAKELSKELNVYNWSYYVAENTISDFEKEFGVKVNYDNFSSNDELLAKLQTGVSGYDVIFPADYMVKIMIEQGLLAELDLENIPNITNLDDRFGKPPYDPQGKFSVAYQWGTTGIGYDATKVREPVTGWEVFWNEAYKGRMTMLDEIRSGLVPALKINGRSVNTTNPAELEEAKQLMFKNKPLLKAYTSSTYQDLLKSSDAWIVAGFSGDIYQVAKENANIKYIIPSQGSDMWVDNMCVPKTAPHKYTAEVFINYMLRAKVSAEISNTTHYASPNKAAKEFIKREILDDPNVYPPPEVMSKLEFLHDVGEATRLWDRTWNEVKAK